MNSSEPIPGISFGPDFKICEADIKLNPRHKINPRGRDLTQDLPLPPLGVLENFKGNFRGKGINFIFRPQSKPPTATVFPDPVTPAPPTPPNDNVLEINLTEESISFSEQLGRVPNRGFQNQLDIILNGVPYVQSVNDVTNMDTGLGDAMPTGIHFEPGLWMHVPATTDPPVAATLTRMASIPHGTTINAQCLEPTQTFNGPPKIAPVDMTPFPVGSTQKDKPIKFPSQTASNGDTSRIPQDLTPFIKAGTITQQILDDPTTVLRKDIEGQKITKTIVFTVSTAPTSPELGGGTANIGFLVGAPAPPAGTTSTAQTGPNGNAIQMTATFWIETVEYELEIPHFKHGHLHAHHPLRIAPHPAHPGAPVPVFEVIPPHDILHPSKIIVQSVQIQYAQQVELVFGGLVWPHISCATLVPAEVQRVPNSAFTQQ